MNFKMIAMVGVIATCFAGTAFAGKCCPNKKKADGDVVSAVKTEKAEIVLVADTKAEKKDAACAEKSEAACADKKDAAACAEKIAAGTCTDKKDAAVCAEKIAAGTCTDKKADTVDAAVVKASDPAPAVVVADKQ